jgi:hypothetical protein
VCSKPTTSTIAIDEMKFYARVFIVSTAAYLEWADVRACWSDMTTD